MPGKKRKYSEITQAGINKGMKQHYSESGLSSYAGAISRQVEQQAPRSYDGGRDTQFLRHFATTLKAWYKEVSGASEVEIQIGLFDNQYYFIGTNDNRTAEFIFESLQDEVPLGFRLSEMISSAKSGASRSTAVDAQRRLRHPQKFLTTLTNAAPDSARTNMVTSDGSALVQKIDACDDIGDVVSKFCTGKLGTKKVMIVTSAQKMHAEQKILLALCKAEGLNDFDRSATILFAGTFRPCRGCYESLKLVQTVFMQAAQFGVRPGHFWKTTTGAHSEIIKILKEKNLLRMHEHASLFDEKGLLLSDTATGTPSPYNTTHHMNMRGGATNVPNYDTDSDSDSE